MPLNLVWPAPIWHPGRACRTLIKAKPPLSYNAPPLLTDFAEQKNRWLCHNCLGTGELFIGVLESQKKGGIRGRLAPLVFSLDP